MKENYEIAASVRARETTSILLLLLIFIVSVVDAKYDAEPLLE